MFHALSQLERLELLGSPFIEIDGVLEPSDIPFDKPEDLISLSQIFYIARARQLESERGSGWISTAAERRETLKILFPEIASGALLITRYYALDVTNLSEDEIERIFTEHSKITRDIKNRDLYKGSAEEIISKLQNDWEKAHARGSDEESIFLQFEIEAFTPEHLYSPDWGYEPQQSIDEQIAIIRETKERDALRLKERANAQKKQSPFMSFFWPQEWTKGLTRIWMALAVSGTYFAILTLLRAAPPNALGLERSTLLLLGASASTILSICIATRVKHAATVTMGIILLGYFWLLFTLPHYEKPPFPFVAFFALANAARAAQAVSTHRS